MSITKRLNETLGGRWKYIYNGQWECDDGRYIIRYAPSVDEFDNTIKGTEEAWLYDPVQDKPKKRAEQYMAPMFKPWEVQGE